jgi:hypothetical protein
VGAYVVISPRDDAPSRQAATWSADFVTCCSSLGHSLATRVDDSTPADASNITRALSGPETLALYFGHGTDGEWLTANIATWDSTGASIALGKAIVSIACRTSRSLGPDAVSAGVRAWLGFTFSVPVIAPMYHVDPIGQAVVRGLSVLATHGSMALARDALTYELGQVVHDLEVGTMSSHPGAEVAMFLVECLRHHVSLVGDGSFVPL